MTGKKIQSYEDLEVYQRLVELHLKINELTMSFPKFEMYELGSQLRRSSNSAPPNLAEGWNNKHIRMYLEGINRSLAELRETKHLLTMAFRKGYFGDAVFQDLSSRYDECGKMLRGLEQSLEKMELLPVKSPLPKFGSFEPSQKNKRTCTLIFSGARISFKC